MTDTVGTPMEDLVLSGAPIVTMVTLSDGVKDKEVLSRSSFATLLGQLGDEHGRTVQNLNMQLADSKSECATLRSRLEVLRQKFLSQTDSMVPKFPSEGASPALSAPDKSLRGSPGPPSCAPEELRLLGHPSSTVGCLVVDVDEDAPEPAAEPVVITQDSYVSEEPAPKESAASFSDFNAHTRWASGDPRLNGVRSPGPGRQVSLTNPSRQVSRTMTIPEEPEGATRPMEHPYDGWPRRFIRYPTSSRQVTWDLIGAVLILYDLVAIPLRVFDPPDTTFTEAIDWFALIFWTLNIFASLTTGYQEDAKFVLDPKLIMRQYMKFWFWIDVAVVAPDWIFTIVQAVLNTENSAGGSVKLLRILRLLRCMRLLRLAKLKWIVTAIKDLINSESIDIAFNISKMILCLVAANHFLACAWYGTSLIGVGNSWVEHHGFENEDWSYKYVTSYHWAITQFTPSSMHVQPQNIYERTFCVIVVIAGLVGFSYLVGSITGSLAELRRMKEDAVKQFWNLRKFLKKTQVPTPLRMRIEKYLEQAYQMQKDAMAGTNLPILKLLTEQLRNELNCAMSMPHLEVHPLFEYLKSTSETAMQRIATKALSRKVVGRCESIFNAGEIAQRMSFVVNGKLYYSKADQNGEWVTQGEDWITEMAMWFPEWTTIGELVSVEVSELLEVCAAEFAEAIKRTPQVYERVCIYALNFVKYLNKQNKSSLSDICQGDIIGKDIKDLLLDKEAEEHIDDVIHNVKKEKTQRKGSKERAAALLKVSAKTFVKPFAQGRKPS